MEDVSVEQQQIAKLIHDHVSQYLGFYRFAKVLELMAKDVANRAIDVPKGH
jgi:hypothetical protein